MRLSDFFHRHQAWYLAALMLLGLAGPSARAGEGVPAADPATVFGVAHVDGKYFLTRQDFLEEGAGQILATGSKVIKLYLTPARYRWNSDWPAGLRSLVEVARTPYFRSVFALPFRTYILTAYAPGRDDHYWNRGVTPAELADETRQFHDLTQYLLATYRGTGKTFVLQHWEGDWALRGRSPKPYDPDYLARPEAVRGMIQWLNARQAGIVRARTDAGPSDVQVYGATEANRLEDSMAGRPGVANSVLPYTTVDLASYSCYNFLNTPERLRQAVDYLAAHLPSTAVFGRNAHSIYLGEFGYPENGAEGAAGVNRRIDNAVTVVRQMGLPWAVFWEVYGNEPVAETLAPPLNGKANDANLRGYWMVKPDGSPGMAWHRYRRLFITADPGRAIAAAVKAGLSPVFDENFNRADGADLGPAWSQAAHYGVATKQISGRHLQINIPDGHDIPWGSATLDLKDPAILGHGLRVGDYFEVVLRRQSRQGALGLELFDSDQLRVGCDIQGGPSPLKAWNGITWVPLSFDDHGQPVTFDWNVPHTVGVRFDSADGQRATFSYYVDGQYAGSWLVATGNPTLDRIGVYAQSLTPNAAFEFDDIKIFAGNRAPGRRFY